MKRIALFLVTNIAVLVVISVVVNVLGLGRIADANGLNLGALLALSAVIGFTGAIISNYRFVWRVAAAQTALG